MSAYLKLEKIFKKVSNLGGAMAVLSWDSATMMPLGGGKERSEQLATLDSVCHEILSSNEISDLLDEAESNKNRLDDWQVANLRNMRHEWKHVTALDNSLVEKLSKAASKCELIWRTARHENDFKNYAKYLTPVLELTREAANAKAEIFGCSPYDAMLDQYDPYRKSEEIDKIFHDLESFLPTFIQTVTEQQKEHPEITPLRGKFSVAKQNELGTRLMEQFGFDFNHGRLDTSHHPFCGGIPDDIRITTRYDESDFTSSLMGVLHETGHAMYENGLPKKWRGQPVGEALGMSIHESQSLLIEMQVCRSRDFLIYATPIIAEIFSNENNIWEASNLHRIYNKVEAGLIRVDADEVTYPAHIIMRYRIEKALISGDMEVNDIPHAWNTAMKELLDVDVPDDRNGCMQDIHWADGSFGYFPTYTLGAIHAAQFFNQAKKDDPEITYGIKRGDFSPLINWLGYNIHSQGSKLSTNDLLIKVTGESLNIDIYKNYLRNRYLS